MLTRFFHFIPIHFAQAYASSEARLAGGLSSKQQILTSMIALASWLIMKCVMRGLADADGIFMSDFTSQMCHTCVILALRQEAVCS